MVPTASATAGYEQPGNASESTRLEWLRDTGTAGGLQFGFGYFYPLTVSFTFPI